MSARINVQNEFAHESRELAMRMPSTVENLSLVLSGLIEAVNDATWADMSLVVSHLEEAMDALKEVRAYSDEEIASWVKERMS